MIEDYMKSLDLLYYAVLLPVLPVKCVTTYWAAGIRYAKRIHWMNFEEKMMSGSVDNSELIWMLGQFPPFV